MTTLDTTRSTPSALQARRGRLILALLCAVAFLDFVDATIINVALPAIRDDLGFSLQQLQWVPSGYLLTYGGFMLLGGRLADRLGRRRVLLAGLVVFAAASLIGGVAGSAELLVAGRMVQGAGAALSLPAALSILTTTFTVRRDRTIALGMWGAIAGVASAAGVLLGGALTEYAGWRWVMLINPIACALLVVPILVLLSAEAAPAVRGRFDVLGTVLVTGAMLLLVHTLVEAPDRGWADAATVLGLTGVAIALAAFLLVERRAADPLLPLGMLRLPGLLAANTVQLTTFGGFLSMFFFVTVYMQLVLGYDAITIGLAYVPSCLVAAMSSGIGSRLIAKLGTRRMVVGGAVVTGAGIAMLSRMSVDGSYVTDLLPGLLVLSSGIGFVFVTVSAAANAGVDPSRAGVAAALLNSAQQLGAALGLAVLAAVASTVTEDQLADAATPAAALVDGFGWALVVGAGLLLVAAVVGLRTVNTHDPEPVG